jgi:transposase-like protein
MEREKLPRTTKEECPRCHKTNVWHAAKSDALFEPLSKELIGAEELWMCRDCGKGFIKEPKSN